MDYIKKLNELKKSEKNNIENLEEIIKLIEQSDLNRENTSLQKQLDDTKNNLDELNLKYNTLNDENQKLRLSLYEQIMDEKLSIIKITKEKLELYFKNEKQKSINLLNEFESSVKNKIGKLNALIEKELKDDSENYEKKNNKPAAKCQ